MPSIRHRAQPPKGTWCGSTIAKTGCTNWYVYPESREAHVYTAADQFDVISERQCVDGRDVLPGLSIPLADLFR